MEGAPTSRSPPPRRSGAARQTCAREPFIRSPAAWPRPSESCCSARDWRAPRACVCRSLPAAATGGASAPDGRAPAAQTTPPVGGTPSSGRTVSDRVIRRPRPISASPATRTIRPGARTTFAIRVQPARTVRSYRLKLWKAPKGVTLRLNRTRTRRKATLTVRTTAGIHTGRYTLRISAWPRRRPGVRRKLKVLRAKLTLVVAVPARRSSRRARSSRPGSSSPPATSPSRSRPASRGR